MTSVLSSLSVFSHSIYTLYRLHTHTVPPGGVSYFNHGSHKINGARINDAPAGATLEARTSTRGSLRYKPSASRPARLEPSSSCMRIAVWIHSHLVRVLYGVGVGVGVRVRVRVRV